MLFPIPMEEDDRITDLANAVIIPSSYHHHTIDDEDVYHFCTYHHDGHHTMLWRYHVDTIAHEGHVNISFTRATRHTIAFPVGGKANRGMGNGSDIIPPLYYIRIDDPTHVKVDTADSIREGIIHQLRTIQSPEHFTQFMMGCKAMQSIIDPHQKGLYIGINRARHDEIPRTSTYTTPRWIHPIYTTRDPGRDSRIPQPEQSSPSVLWHIDTVCMQNHLEEQSLNKHTSHKIHHTDMDTLHTALGPWMHPIIEQATFIHRPSVGGMFQETMRCKPWIDTEHFMPPQWGGLTHLWDRHRYSAHEWMAIQRQLHEAIHTITPLIHPYITPT